MFNESLHDVRIMAVKEEHIAFGLPLLVVRRVDCEPATTNLHLLPPIHLLRHYGTQF